MDFDPWAENEAEPIEEVPEIQYDQIEEVVPFSAIQVKEIPQKEGLLFKHTNYQVIKDEYKVIRRYSDFAWLVEYLLKKYTFRIIPQLPPKKFGSANNDTLFLQRRRRGLQRFINQLCKHPVLAKENIVQMFLTVPDDFSNWRKVAQFDWDNEFDKTKLPLLPQRFRINLNSVLAGLNVSTEIDIGNENNNSNDFEVRENQRQSNQTVINRLKHIWRENPIDNNEMDFVSNINTINQSLTDVASIWSKMFSLIERIEKRELALVVDQLKFSSLVDDMVKSDVGIYGLSTIGGNIEEEQNLSTINQVFRSVQSYFQTCKKDKTNEMIDITNALETWKSLQDYFTSFHYLIERLALYRLESDREIQILLTEINKSIERFIQMKSRLDFKPIHADKVVLTLNEDVQKLNKMLTKILAIKEAFIIEYKLFQNTKYIMSGVISQWFKERAHLMDNNNENIQRLLNVLNDLPN